MNRQNEADIQELREDLIAQTGNSSLPMDRSLQAGRWLRALDTFRYDLEDAQGRTALLEERAKRLREDLERAGKPTTPPAA